MGAWGMLAQPRGCNPAYHHHHIGHPPLCQVLGSFCCPSPGLYAPHVPPYPLQHLTVGSLQARAELGPLGGDAQELAEGLLAVPPDPSPAPCQPLLPRFCLLRQCCPQGQQCLEMGQHGRDVLELGSERGLRACRGRGAAAPHGAGPTQGAWGCTHLPHPGQHILQATVEALEALEALG